MWTNILGVNMIPFDWNLILNGFNWGLGFIGAGILWAIAVLIFFAIVGALFGGAKTPEEYAAEFEKELGDQTKKFGE